VVDQLTTAREYTSPEATAFRYRIKAAISETKLTWEARAKPTAGAIPRETDSRTTTTVRTRKSGLPANGNLVKLTVAICYTSTFFKENACNSSKSN